MPNWVANHLKIYGENAVDVLRSLLENGADNENDCGYDFDFNKIIPMPESLQIESGSVTNNCVELYLTSINPFVDYYGENKLGADEYLQIYNAVQGSKTFITFNDKLSLEEIHRIENNIQVGNSIENSKKLTREEALAYGNKAVDNVLTYGAMDWYDWSCRNWGPNGTPAIRRFRIPRARKFTSIPRGLPCLR